MSRILGIDVDWADRFANSPRLELTVDGYPDDRVYIRRDLPDTGRYKGWRIYWSEVDGLVWFFTWGGVPDDGFGGWARDVPLDDGTTDRVVGGWHARSDIPPQAGFPPIMECVLKKDGDLSGVASFVLLDVVTKLLEEQRPDLELVSEDRFMTVKWRGQISKAEFLRLEHDRRASVREQLKAKYSDGTWHHGDWYKKFTPDERVEMSQRPYSALGPALAERAA